MSYLLVSLRWEGEKGGGAIGGDNSRSIAADCLLRILPLIRPAQSYAHFLCLYIYTM